MNRLRSRRAFAFLASALIGLLGANWFAAAAHAVPSQPAPVSAHPGPGMPGHPAPAHAVPTHTTPAGGEVAGSCGWDADAREWVVTWTITIAAAEPYRVATVESTPAEHPVDGVQASPPAEFPHPAGDPLVAAQRIPHGPAAASVEVIVEFPGGATAAAAGELTIPDDCQLPELPDLISEVGFDCHWLSITIDNPGDDSLRLTLLPSGGEPLDVEVAGGESATVEFPAGKGRSVDVLLAGQSIVDPADPIRVSPADWAATGCPDADDHAADLPATGAPIGLVAAGALALLGLGGGLYLLARRHRIRFTT